MATTKRPAVIFECRDTEFTYNALINLISQVDATNLSVSPPFHPNEYEVYVYELNDSNCKDWIKDGWTWKDSGVTYLPAKQSTEHNYNSDYFKHCSAVAYDFKNFPNPAFQRHAYLGYGYAVVWYCGDHNVAGENLSIIDTKQETFDSGTGRKMYRHLLKNFDLRTKHAVEVFLQFKAEGRPIDWKHEAFQAFGERYSPARTRGSRIRFTNAVVINGFSIEDGVLMAYGDSKASYRSLRTQKRPVLVLEDYEQVFYDVHTSQGHPGRDTTREAFLSKYAIVNSTKVDRLVRDCPVCLAYKHTSHRPVNPVAKQQQKSTSAVKYVTRARIALPVSTHPNRTLVKHRFERLDLDCIAVIHPVSGAIYQCFTRLDAYSKYAWLDVVSCCNSAVDQSFDDSSPFFVEKLRNQFLELGIAPKTSLSNKKPGFVNREFQELIMQFDIKHSYTGGNIQSAYFHKKLNAEFASLVTKEDLLLDINTALKFAVFYYNTSAHPALHRNGFNLRPVDVWRPGFTPEIEDAAEIHLDNSSTLDTMPDGHSKEEKIPGLYISDSDSDNNNDCDIDNDDLDSDVLSNDDNEDEDDDNDDDITPLRHKQSLVIKPGDVGMLQLPPDIRELDKPFNIPVKILGISAHQDSDNKLLAMTTANPILTFQYLHPITWDDLNFLCITSRIPLQSFAKMGQDSESRITPLHQEQLLSSLRPMSIRKYLRDMCCQRPSETLRDDDVVIVKCEEFDDQMEFVESRRQGYSRGNKDEKSVDDSEVVVEEIVTDY